MTYVNLSNLSTRFVRLEEKNMSNEMNRMFHLLEKCIHEQCEIFCRSFLIEFLGKFSNICFEELRISITLKSFVDDCLSLIINAYLCCILQRERERWWRDNWIALNIHVRIDAKWDKLQHRHSFPCELISNYSSYLSSFPWNQPLYLSDERAQDHAHAKDVQWQIDSRYSRLHLHQKWRPVEYSNDREYWLIHCQVHLMMDISFRWKNKQC